MSKCPGLHCPGCGGGGGSGASALLVLLAVIIIAAIARPVVHAAEVVLEVVLITAASVTGLAVLTGSALLVRVAMRRHARNYLNVSRHAPIVLRGSQAVSAPPRRAIETGRHVIDGVVLRDEITERQ